MTWAGDLKSRHRSEVATWCSLESAATWVLRLQPDFLGWDKVESYEEQLEVATRNGRRDLTELGKTELRPKKKKNISLWVRTS